jgi:hypothetical protein
MYRGGKKQELDARSYSVNDLVVWNGTSKT